MRALAVVFLTLSLWASSAHAREMLPTQVNLYGVYWGGFHIGDLIIATKQEKDTCTVETYIRSHGLAKLISGFRSDTKSTIHCVENKRNSDSLHADYFVPQFYETHFTLRKRDRNIELTYSKDGKEITKDYNHPPENREKRAAVSDEDKSETHDPLSSAALTRNIFQYALEHGQAPEPFIIGMYDGRRRTDIELHYVGTTPEGNHTIEFRELPISGYTNNELRDYKKSKNRYYITVDAKTYMPLKALGESTLGNANILFTRQCESVESCLTSISK